MQMRYIIQGINGLEDFVYCKELRLSAAVNRIYSDGKERYLKKS